MKKPPALLLISSLLHEHSYDERNGNLFLLEYMQTPAVVVRLLHSQSSDSRTQMLYAERGRHSIPIQFPDPPHATPCPSR